MKIEGCSDIVIAQLPGNRVSFTIQFDTAKNAERTYFDACDNALRGNLVLRFEIAIKEH